MKMPHRFFYVYEIKGDSNLFSMSLENILSVLDESPSTIDGKEFIFKIEDLKTIESLIHPYYFENQKEIIGKIYFNNREVPFKIRPQSKLLFVETPHHREKLMILQIFNNKFRNLDIDLFAPNNEEEKEFICNTATYDDFKVFMDDKIVRKSDVDEDLCDGLMSNMELIEATLRLNIHDHIITFYYYGNAIQFPHSEEKDIEGVIQTFENTMMAQAK